MAVAPPQAAPESVAGYIWTLIDKRIQSAIKTALDTWGRPRARVVTVNIPVAGQTVSPLPGWLTSFGIAHDCRIVDWWITSLIAGEVSLDLQVTSPQPSQATAIVPVSIVNGNFPAVNGYTSAGGTVGWTTTLLAGGTTVHVICNNAVATVLECVLVLRMIDTASKTIAR